jgi:hypothetical protein
VRKLFFVFAVIVVFSGCDFNFISGEGTNSFEYKLRGKWESVDKSVYSGTLKIDYSTIEISGFLESQTPRGQNDEKRPFRDITNKGVKLEGYSQDDQFFIKEFGALKEGILYEYDINYGEESLRFDFGGRYETMRKVEEEEDEEDYEEYWYY